MADGTIGRANVEIGANTAPLDADLAGVKSKVEKAAQGAEESAKTEVAAKAQVAKTEAATTQKTNERLAAEIKITQETLKQAAAKRRAADDQVKEVKHVSDNLNAGAASAGAAAGSSGGGGLFGTSGITGFATAVGSIIGSINTLWNGLKGAALAARELSSEFRSMSDAFGGDKMQFMGEMTKQMEQAKRTFREQSEQIEQYKYTLEGFIDWSFQNSSKQQIMFNQLQNEMNAQLTRIMEAQKLKIKQQLLELTLEVRKFREEVNAASSIGTQPIELAAVSEAIRVLALRSETSR